VGRRKKQACKRGTNIHKILEDYISYGDVKIIMGGYVSRMTKLQRDQ
jgi:hypothetical protein